MTRPLIAAAGVVVLAALLLPWTWLLMLLVGAALGAGGYHLARTRVERPAAAVESGAAAGVLCFDPTCYTAGHDHSSVR